MSLFVAYLWGCNKIQQAPILISDSLLKIQTALADAAGDVAFEDICRGSFTELPNGETWEVDESAFMILMKKYSDADSCCVCGQCMLTVFEVPMTNVLEVSTLTWEIENASV